MHVHTFDRAAYSAYAVIVNFHSISVNWLRLTRNSLRLSRKTAEYSPQEAIFNYAPCVISNVSF